MTTFRIRLLPVLLLLGSIACKDTDTATAPGALASVRVNAPESVRSGESFTIDVDALAIGINNVRNGRVSVTLPAPLSVTSVEASSKTAATFSNGTGATVIWNLNTLDSNSQSRLHIHAIGLLPAGSGPRTLTVRGSLTADGVREGDAVGEDRVRLDP